MSKNEDTIHAETSRGHQPIYTGVQALPPRHIHVIGVPLDLGQSRRGVDMGPSAVRVAGLEAHLEALGHVVTDAGILKSDVKYEEIIDMSFVDSIHA